MVGWVGGEGVCELCDEEGRSRIMPQSRPKRQIKYCGGNSEGDLQCEECEEELRGAGIFAFPQFDGEYDEDEQDNQCKSAVDKVH